MGDYENELRKALFVFKFKHLVTSITFKRRLKRLKKNNNSLTLVLVILTKL